MRARTKKAKGAFGRLVERALEPCQIVDENRLIRSTLAGMKREHWLDADIYGRPTAIDLDWQQQPTENGLKEICQRVEALYEGRQARVVAVSFHGRPQSKNTDSISIDTEFLLVAEGEKDDKKQHFIAVATKSLANGDEFQRDIRVIWPKFANWALKEKISLVRQGDEWVWASKKSLDPMKITVMHKERAYQESWNGHCELEILSDAANELEREYASHAQERAVAAARRKARAEKADAALQEKLRLERLLPHEAIPKALALQERAELIATADKAMKSRQKSPQSAPVRHSPRL